MKTCTRLYVLTLSLILSLPYTAEAQESVDTRIARIENGLLPLLVVTNRPEVSTSLADLMVMERVPAVSVAVIEGSRIIWAEAYGLADVESGTPATTSTLFQAASISKPVAAMAALRLVERGVLDLDGDINEWLTSWRLPSNEFTEDEAVTLRHLLTHTGGLTVHGFPGYARSADIPILKQVLDGEGPTNTGAIRVDASPGSLWRYSGGGYTIMQQLLIGITGKPFHELVKESVLEPAGMERSTYEQPLPPERWVEAATGYRWNGVPVEEKWHVYPEMAAAGLWTTPTDLARLALEVQSSLEGESNRVLGQSTTEAMLEKGRGNWGLGFQICGRGRTLSFEHGGSNEGFRASFVAFAEIGKGAFIMTNSDAGSSVAQALILTIAQEFGWPEAGFRPRRMEAADVDRGTLERLTGLYRISGADFDIEITSEGNRLFVKNWLKVELYPMSENTWFTSEDATRFDFEIEQPGKAVALMIDRSTRAERVR